MKGIIIKGISGFYYVKCGENIYRCRARGIFKKDRFVPLTGDEVDITPGTDCDGMIEKFYERKNFFVRPPVANADILVAVVSVAAPEPDIFLIDRLLAAAEKNGMDSLICINKTDLGSEEDAEKIRDIYQGIYPIAAVCGLTGIGIDRMTAYIRDKKAVLTGPSGAGKSTILNRLKPDAGAATGSISPRTKHGRHTTRHVELFQTDHGGMIFDTPGFTSFEAVDTDSADLQFLYPEIRDFPGACRYADCMHISEPGCRIIKAVDDGHIKSSRYDSYLRQYEEINSRNRYRHDTERK